MKCPSCGFADDGRFCKQCGAPLVSEQKADWLGTPKFTGITIPPPSASQGFKAEDIEELGLPERDPHLASGEVTSESTESVGNSFGLLLIVILIVAIAIFTLKLLGVGH